MNRCALILVSTGEDLLAIIRALRAELSRLNRFAVAEVSHVGRRERARIVAAELARRYRSPNRCC